MSARRGAACYAQAKFYIESRFTTQNKRQQDQLQARSSSGRNFLSCIFYDLFRVLNVHHLKNK